MFSCFLGHPVSLCATRCPSVPPLVPLGHPMSLWATPCPIWLHCRHRQERATSHTAVSINSWTVYSVTAALIIVPQCEICVTDCATNFCMCDCIEVISDCGINNGQCSQLCHQSSTNNNSSTPRRQRCACESGYQLQQDKVTCKGRLSTSLCFCK